MGPNLETVTMLMEMNLSLNDYEYSIETAVDDILNKTPSLLSQYLDTLIHHCTFAEENDLNYNTAELAKLANKVADGKKWYSLEDFRPRFEASGLQLNAKVSQPAFGSIDWWQIDRPERLLSLLKEDGVSPFTFRETIKKGWLSSLGDFATSYLIARGNHVKGWRELARWISSDARPLEMSVPHDQLPDFTPLVAGLTLAHGRSQDLILAKSRFRQWVEDLDLGGVDLMEYGKLESVQLTKTHRKPVQALLDQLWSHYSWYIMAYSIAEVIWECLPYRLTYGPCPQDWDVLLMDEVFFEYEAKGWLEDFWKLVEPVEMSIPGAWVDEDE